MAQGIERLSQCVLLWNRVKMRCVICEGILGAGIRRSSGPACLALCRLEECVCFTDCGGSSASEGMLIIESCVIENCVVSTRWERY